jgi:hypothetical protein
MTSVILLLILLGGFVLLCVAILVRRFGVRRKRAQERDPEAGRTRCRCGYPLDELHTIRCPECGRVQGFDATAEELGLTDEQLQRAKSRRDERAQDAG